MKCPFRDGGGTTTSCFIFFFSGSSSSHPKHWLPNTLQVGCTVLTWHQQRITSQSWRRETTAVWSLLVEVEALFLCFPSWEQPLTKRTLFFSRGAFHAEQNGKLICAAWWSITSAGTDGLTCAGLEEYNGHLLWITHSKMSTRLLAATVFCFFSALGARRRGVTIRKPPQLHMSMHHSWAGNDAHCENDARKNRKIMAVKRMIVCFRFKELSVKSSILIRQPCVTVCPGPSM